jgi:hypothetical protein
MNSTGRAQSISTGWPFVTDTPTARATPTPHPAVPSRNQLTVALLKYVAAPGCRQSFQLEILRLANMSPGRRAGGSGYPNYHDRGTPIDTDAVAR